MTHTFTVRTCTLAERNNVLIVPTVALLGIQRRCSTNRLTHAMRLLSTQYRLHSFTNASCQDAENFIVSAFQLRF